MRHLILAVMVLGCASIALPAFVLAAQCGTERWEVKVGRDRDASKIDTAGKSTDVATLAAIKPPASPNKRGKSRWTPTELVVYEVEATIVLVKLEKDRDYHIVIQGKDGTTMIVEAPHPDCAKGSQFEAEIKTVRAAINKHFGGAIRGKKDGLNIKAKIRGVAFFDILHGQEGVAQNGIELHPILDIQFE